jgi:hypothetical protein
MDAEDRSLSKDGLSIQPRRSSASLIPRAARTTPLVRLIQDNTVGRDRSHLDKMPALVFIGTIVFQLLLTRMLYSPVPKAE